MRTIPVVEKNLVAVPTAPINVPANTVTTVLPDISNRFGETAVRQIFNSGGSNCFYAIGYEASPAAYNAYLVPGQMLDCTNYGTLPVTVFSVAGTTISVTILNRNDNMVPNQNIITPGV